MTQSDKGLVKIAEDASSRRHAENSPIKVKDTHLMNNKLPLAEILCGECSRGNDNDNDNDNDNEKNFIAKQH